MEYVRCKVCGYIMAADKVKDICPACGVSAEKMEPYKYAVSEKRLMILRLDIHPVIVHIPQALAALLVVISAIMLMLGPDILKDELYATTVVLAAILPLAVLGALASGIFDGKVRFKKITTPVLRRKMLFGILFLIASSGAAALTIFGDIKLTSTLILLLVLEAVSLGAGAALGIMGSRLLGSVMPGK